MMSYSEICRINREVARQRRKPIALFPEDVREDGTFAPGFKIPNLGRRTVRGFRLVSEQFVDKTGAGSASEPAMTQGAFCRDLLRRCKENGYRYFIGVTEEGPFQVYVGIFESTKNWKEDA